MATQLELAEQQLVGYFHAKQGYSLRDLIESMGLGKEEWQKLKSKYPLDYIEKDDIDEIDEIVDEN